MLAVSDNSPAADAGIRPADQIAKFGTVNADNFTSLRSISEVGRC
jgi:S1-C subfamily serine protease